MTVVGEKADTETQIRVTDPRGGSNQVRVRAYNERLVLSLVRRHGGLSKSEIAGKTGLSAQTVSVIMRALEVDGLLVKGTPRRGKVGQPSVPLMLNPDGVYALGLKVGRKSADLVMIDFIGKVRSTTFIEYQWPEPQSLIDFAKIGVKKLSLELSPAQRRRISGLGVATPFQLWNWAGDIGAPQERMALWKDFDFEKNLEQVTSLPVHLQNDATSACGAELAFGLGAELQDFIYFFVGTFIGGGIVLNHSLYVGNTGNAGAIGPMPVLLPDGSSRQLLKFTSIIELEREIKREVGDVNLQWRSISDWENYPAQLGDWIEITAKHLALAITSACSIIDFEAAVIDGAFPEGVRTRLVERIYRYLADVDFQGIERPRLLPGTIGQNARAIGGASQPLFDRFLLDQNVLFKSLAD